MATDFAKQIALNEYHIKQLTLTVDMLLKLLRVWGGIDDATVKLVEDLLPDVISELSIQPTQKKG